MKSEIRFVSDVKFPAFEGTRVMMMPFHTHDVKGSFPENLQRYVTMIQELCDLGNVPEGVGYITIDEAFVKKHETHRRPGLHVDGVGPDGRTPGSWGGGGKYGACGMIVAASHTGCVAWNQEFKGKPGPDGDCEHLFQELDFDKRVYMRSNQAYYCNPTAVHQSLNLLEDTKRQFIRISFPNDAPWHEGYTENPLGIKATGPTLPARTQYMAYRASA